MKRVYEDDDCESDDPEAVLDSDSDSEVELSLEKAVDDVDCSVVSAESDTRDAATDPIASVLAAMASDCRSAAPVLATRRSTRSREPGRTSNLSRPSMTSGTTRMTRVASDETSIWTMVSAVMAVARFLILSVSSGFAWWSARRTMAMKRAKPALAVSLTFSENSR